MKHNQMECQRFPDLPSLSSKPTVPVNKSGRRHAQSMASSTLASFLTGSQTPPQDTSLAEPLPSASRGGEVVALWTQKTSLRSFWGSMRVICQLKVVAKNGAKGLDSGPGVQRL